MIADAHGNFSGKHLVILGAGYVGTAIAREAVGRGMRVTALTRNPTKAAALRESGITVVTADLADAGWHAHIEGGAEFVLNCVSSGGGGVAGYVHSYLRGMESVLVWMRRGAPVGTLVYTSSTSVYPQDGGVRVDENAPTEGSGDRVKLLLETENLVRTAVETGICKRWFVLRLAGIYGPGRHHLLEQVRTGEVSGRGDYHLNLIYRDDIAAAIWAVFGAREEARNQVFNVADDGATTKDVITEWLAMKIGVPRPRFTGEASVGRRAVTPDRIITNTKLRLMLGWQPRYPSFREGYTAILSA